MPVGRGRGEQNSNLGHNAGSQRTKGRERPETDFYLRKGKLRHIVGKERKRPKTV